MMRKIPHSTQDDEMQLTNYDVVTIAYFYAWGTTRISAGQSRLGDS